MSGKDDQPTPPNPYQLASAQGALNTDTLRESARINSTDQFAPWGATTWMRDRQGNPLAQVIQLGDKEQSFYDTTAGVRNSLADAAQGQAQYLPDKAFSTAGMKYNPAGIAANTTIDRNTLTGLPKFNQINDRINLGALPGVKNASTAVRPSQLPNVAQASNKLNMGALPNVGKATSIVNNSSYGAMPTADAETRQRVERAMYDRMMGLQSRDLDSRRNQMNTMLAERGIPIGAEIDSNERNRYDQMVNELQQNAAMDSVITGGQEMQRMQDMSLGLRDQRFQEQQGMAADQSRILGHQEQARGRTLGEQQAMSGEQQRIINAQEQARARGLGEQQAAGADQSRVIGLQNQAWQRGLTGQQAKASEQSRVADLIAAQRQQYLGERQAVGAEQSRVAALQQALRGQQINEALLNRTQPMNELSAFLNGAPALPTPSFMGQYQASAPAPDLMGAAYNSYNAQAQNHRNNQSNLWGGLSTLGSAAIGLL